MNPDNEVKDLTIIGAGPTGLFAAFYAGMRGATARLVDALDQVGGQVTALYPEKDIFDVGGFPKILGKDLVKQLKQQGLQWGAPVHLAETVTGLRREVVEEGRQGFVIVTERAEYKSRALIITAGLGAFTPRKLPVVGVEQWDGKGVFDRVLNPQQFKGQRVIIVGGGDSAFDWCVNLIDVAKSVSLVHRRDGFRAHQATIDQVMGYVKAGRMQIKTFCEIKTIHGGSRVESATIADTKAKTEEQVAVDVIIPQLGFHTALGAIEEWGLDIEKGEIKVSSTMATNIPGIYAAGDVNTFEGKLKLIATGFADACVAVNYAVNWINPGKKVDPGHSSNMALFESK
ncbi:MAG: NAD(P)/FAD-dependent oxidoreductase [Gemmatimonadetes bacterium]|nr:NAD(P)/FAD-dependent oxidoreductase [Gemmatimonadota bacterium]